MVTRKTDVVVVGGGPAGVQSATWCAQSAVDHVLIEKGKIGGLQAKSPYSNSWLSVFPKGTPARNVAEEMRKRVAENGTPVVDSEAVLIQKTGKGFRVDLANGGQIETRFVLLATGTRERDEPAVPADKKVVGLAQVESFEMFLGKRVAILGGGDAAFQCGNALRKVGHEDWRLFARKSSRANRKQWAVRDEDVVHGNIQIADGWIGHADGRYPYDVVLVMYGWEAVLPVVAPSLALKQGYVVVERSMETSVPGVFAAGDILADSHPCVASALGTASVATQMIVRRLNGLPTI